MQTRLNFTKFHGANLLKAGAKLGAVAVLLAACLPVAARAQQAGQKTFSSAEDASNALVRAAQNNDDKMMIEILGPDGKANCFVRRRGRGSGESGQFREEIRGDAPAGQRAGRNHDSLYRRRELADSDTAGE